MSLASIEDKDVRLAGEKLVTHCKELCNDAKDIHVAAVSQEKVEKVQDF
jgi:hypothetical protein